MRLTTLTYGPDGGIAGTGPVMSATAGEDLPGALIPVYVAADGKAYAVDNSETGVKLMAGLLRKTGLMGATVSIWLPGQVVAIGPAATLGTEVWAYNKQLVSVGAVPANAWYRRVGAPTAAGEIFLELGPIQRRAP